MATFVEFFDQKLFFILFFLHNFLAKSKLSFRSRKTVNSVKPFAVLASSENIQNVNSQSLQLYSPEDWAPVPNTEMGFGEMEVVTSCEEVALRSESTLSGLQPYLAIGTINNYGEEVGESRI